MPAPERSFLLIVMAAVTVVGGTAVGAGEGRARRAAAPAGLALLALLARLLGVVALVGNRPDWLCTF